MSGSEEAKLKRSCAIPRTASLSLNVSIKKHSAVSGKYKSQ